MSYYVKLIHGAIIVDESFKDILFDQSLSFYTFDMSMTPDENVIGIECIEGKRFDDSVFLDNAHLFKDKSFAVFKGEFGEMWMYYFKEFDGTVKGFRIEIDPEELLEQYLKGVA